MVGELKSSLLFCSNLLCRVNNGGELLSTDEQNEQSCSCLMRSHPVNCSRQQRRR